MSNHLAIAIAASLSLAIATPLLAADADVPQPSGYCIEVLSEAKSAVLPEGGELGTMSGLLNGAFYLSYSEETDAKGDGPNLVIKTEDGRLDLWLAGESWSTEDGGQIRKLNAVAASGTDDYAGAIVNLSLQGTFLPAEGGRYQLVGTICAVSEVVYE